MAGIIEIQKNLCPKTILFFSKKFSFITIKKSARRLPNVLEQRLLYTKEMVRARTKGDDISRSLQVQTGLFLDVAPNGLFGLGPEVYSVPSTLAANSIVSNHIFSMCFTYLGTRGRLIFGKKPPNSSIVSQTPLIPITPRYVSISSSCLSWIILVTNTMYSLFRNTSQRCG